MKKFLSLLTIASFVSIIAFGQETEQKLEQLEVLEADTLAVAPDTTAVQQPDSVAAKEDSFNETSFKIGNKEVIIKENENDEESTGNDENEDDEWENVGGARNFEGHLGGFEFGFNSYASHKFGTTVDDADYDLNTTKSTNFNIILPGLDLGFCRRVGLVTSIGFNFSSYRFDNNVTLVKDADGSTVLADPGVDCEKSKLSTVYATVPLILEAQIPLSDGNALNFGVGVIGGIKLGSHTKIVYENDGRQKDKVHDDFNLSLLRYGVTARAGYKMMQIYGTYYLSPLFETGKGPQLYPFEVGIALTFND